MLISVNYNKIIFHLKDTLTDAIYKCYYFFLSLIGRISKFLIILTEI